jgi:phosphoribosylformylglycinamidine synthase subunit PurS
MKWKVRIEIMLKKSILDPQGQAVKGGLTALGYRNVLDVHVGKYMELLIDEDKDRELVSKQVDEMCQRLLANPVIEDYIYQIEDVG